MKVRIGITIINFWFSNNEKSAVFSLIKPYLWRKLLLSTCANIKFCVNCFLKSNKTGQISWICSSSQYVLSHSESFFKTSLKTLFIIFLRQWTFVSSESVRISLSSATLPDHVSYWGHALARWPFWWYLKHSDSLLPQVIAVWPAPWQSWQNWCSEW